MIEKSRNQQIIVDPEFHSLIPSLSSDETQLLEKSLLSEGCRDALVVWQESILVREEMSRDSDGQFQTILLDGYNRLEICKKYNIDYDYTDVQNIDPWDRNGAKLWIIRNQLARRNLADWQKYELVQIQQEILHEQGRKKMSEGGQGLSTIDKPSEPHNTQIEIAKALGWSTGKVAQADYIAKRIDGETKEKLRKAETTINREYKGITQKPHVAQNTGNNEWYTPPQYINAARKVMEQIDLDPASSVAANEFVKAAKFYTIEDDGLCQSWRGCIWMNPPYASSLVQQFSDKLLEELSNIEQAIVLVNNATETRWFQSLLTKADAVCFLRGRVKFLNESGEPVGVPLQGQAILYFGSSMPIFEEIFSEFGQVLKHV